MQTKLETFDEPIKLLNGPSVYNFTNQKPTDLVIFLHGYGSYGKDLINLSQHLEEAFDRPYFIAPNAPFPYEFIGATFPNEFQWYSLLDRSDDALMEGSRKAEIILNHFINEKLKELDLTDENLSLIGFSQGTMIALHTALRREKPCKAIIAFSGTMVEPQLLKAEIKSRPKICFIHGTEDSIVPIGLGKIAYTYLVENKVEAEFHKVPALSHSIDFNAIKIARDFIAKQ